MIVIYFYASYRINFSIDSIESVEINNNHERALIDISAYEKIIPVGTDFFKTEIYNFLIKAFYMPR